MRDPIGEKGYVFERRCLNRDLFYLLCIFGGSRRLAEIGKGGEHDMAWEMMLAFQRVEVQRLMMSIAVQTRIMYDQTTPLTEDDPDYDIMRDYDYRKEDKFQSEGEFWANKQSPEPQPLSFREACNKIIHAKGFHLHQESLPTDSGGKFLLPKVTLEGIHHEMPWKAVVQIEQFADRAYSFTSMDPFDGI